MSSAELKYSLDDDWWNSLSEKLKQSILRDLDNWRFVSDHEVKATVNKLLGRA